MINPTFRFEAQFFPVKTGLKNYTPRFVKEWEKCTNYLHFSRPLTLKALIGLLLSVFQKVALRG